MNSETVELVPNPAILMQSMRHIGYSLDTALADIIDNSISANASIISIQFRWNNANPWIAIIDDGCGMTKNDLHEAMRFGGKLPPTQSRSDIDLGRFGLGLKTASLSQCRRLTVISKKDNIINSCVWDIDNNINLQPPRWDALILSTEQLYVDTVTSGLLTHLEKTPSGTIVLWQNLDNLSEEMNKNGYAQSNFSETMAQASKHIALVFHRFFSMEKGHKAVKIDFNGTVVEGINPFGTAIPARQELQDETILLENQIVNIQPFVLPHNSKVSKQDYDKLGGEDGYLQNQGFYVYRNRRLIIKATWFRIIPKAELTKLLRIRIDIPNSLDHLWQLDVKKSTVSPPLAVLKRLRELLPALTNRGKRPYAKRGTRAITDITYLWRREFANDKVSYIINEEHPLVRNLIVDANGEIDKKKLSCLRIISDAFPAQTFHLDVNNDTKTTIVSTTKKDEAEDIIRELILQYYDLGLDKEAILRNMSKNEFPIPEDRCEELVEEVLNGKC